MLRKEALDAGIKELPPLPSIIIEILDALNRKNVSIDFLNHKIIQDPALASKVLAVANSPFYGMSGNIVSINDACIVLGLNTLANITIAIGVVDNYSTARGHHIDFEKLWQHALGTGAVAKVLAKECCIDRELAFTTGMLHDIGKMIFDQSFPDEYEHVVNIAKSNNCLLYEAERKFLGIDHGVMGGMVVQRWNLSSEIVKAIHSHHDADINKCNKLTSLIKVADIISRSLGIGDPGDDIMPSLDMDVLNYLGLDMAIIEDYSHEFHEQSEMARSYLQY